MPGILPMKVIKVGNSAQSRIAQACDRCRSKKIRCDGTRPTCSQCANVGFECRTSDKLSRRAFPRGYTESLEERVRALEAEVRELKDLLDEKDEKIDMLAKMQTNRRRRASGSSQPSPASSEADKHAPVAKEDTFRVQASPLLLGVENSDSYFMGSSSGRAFIEAFKRKVQEVGKPCGDFSPEAFLHTQGCAPLVPEEPEQTLRAPPRIFSDRCVNVYFQEWAPLFPVLHKPTFLRLYEDFGADPDKIKSPHKIAQLYLVFSIAGLSSSSPDFPQLAACERHWTKAIDSILMDNTMGTLQCLILALLYCIMRADYKRLQHYKGIAVGLSHRLGLHQSQKRFSFGALTIETRKKVFWTLYTLDCFSAAILGLPKLLKEDDVQTEYPSDADDEYVTEKGFQPTLPGEYTRLSSALALFKATRILARVLEKIYPATTPYELSLQQMEALASELDDWYENLPSHLRLNFAQDKPSTDVTGSRSPLLALGYYFIRNLIYRPAIGSSLGSKAAPALLMVGNSSKSIVQIIQLLDERSMTFAFCLNKHDLLLICGMALLYRTIDLNKDSKIMRDDERLVNAIAKLLGNAKVPGLAEFRRIASMLVTLDSSTLEMGPPARIQRAATRSPSCSQKSSTKSPTQHKARHSIGRVPEATVSESDLLQQQEKLRRMTMSSLEGVRLNYKQAAFRQSLDNIRQNSHGHVGRHGSKAHAPTSPPIPGARHLTNYMPLGTDMASQARSLGQPHTSSPHQAQAQAQALANTYAMTKSYNVPSQPGQDWETMLGSMDNGINNVYDAIYGGPGFVYEPAPSTNSSSTGWSPDTVDLSTFSITDLDTFAGAAQSVHSLSDESLSSGEEAASSDLGVNGGNLNYHNQLLSIDCGTNDGFVDGLEGFAF